MNGEEALLKTAKELINNVLLNEIETINLETTKYDDGSKALNIVLTYPAEQNTITTEFFLDGEQVE